MKRLTIFTLIFTAIFYCNIAYTQSPVYGEIFPEAEADSLFGPADISIEIASNELLSIAEASVDYLMFLIEENSLIILDDFRNLLSPRSYAVQDDKEFHMFSIIRIRELIRMGGADVCVAQMRSDIFALSNGGYVLEVGVPCPPFCKEP